MARQLSTSIESRIALDIALPLLLFCKGPHVTRHAGRGGVEV
jgi:hypothetical protein